jgi:DNA mismatch repair protein MSH5
MLRFVMASPDLDFLRLTAYQPPQVSCAGAVLGDLHRRRSVGFLPNGHRAGVVFQVRSLNMFAMSDYMVVSSETMLALQILQSELHPNCQTWGPDLGNSSSKESLSVYGLFHALASTSQGQKILRQMFLRPTQRLSIIAERQRSISSLLRPENSELVKQAIGILRKMKNVKVAVAQLRKGVDSPISSTSFDRGVWATVRGFAAQVLRLRELAGSFMNSEHIVGLCKVS